MQRKQNQACAAFVWVLLMCNFTPAATSECVINTVDEMDDVFWDYGIMLDFGQAIDNEMAAVDVVSGILESLLKS